MVLHSSQLRPRLALRTQRRTKGGVGSEALQRELHHDNLEKNVGFFALVVGNCHLASDFSIWDFLYQSSARSQQEESSAQVWGGPGRDGLWGGRGGEKARER